MYNGHSAKGNFDVELKLRFFENEALNAIKFVSAVGKRLQIVAKPENGGETIKLGIFNFYNLKFDKDANAYLSVRANQEYCFVNNMTKLMQESLFVFKARVIEDYA